MTELDQLLRSVVRDGFVLEVLLSLVLQALWLAPVALVLSLLLRRSSASTRHLAWLLLLIAMLTAPILSICSPSRIQFSILKPTPEPSQIGVAVPPDHFLKQRLRTKAPVQKIQMRGQQPSDPLAIPATLDSAAANEPAGKVTDQVADQVLVAKLPAVTAQPAEHTVANSKTVMPTPEVSPIRQTELLLTCVWLVGAVLLSLRLIAGQFSMWRTLRTSSEISDEGVLTVVAKVISTPGARRRIFFLEHAQSSMPMTCGVWSPLIILPSTAKEWSAERLRMVLLHELAHVQRRDCLWQWVTHLATAVQWFNPLVWLVASRLKNEREQACDDAVLNTGVPGSDYAETLLDLSTGGRRHVVEMCAGLAMARPQRLSARVESIVDEHRHRGPVAVQAGVGAVLVTLVLMIPLGLMAQAEITLRQPLPPNDDAPSSAENQPQQQQLQQMLQVFEAGGIGKQVAISQQREKPTLPHVTLPGGQMMRRSGDHAPLVDAAMALLQSASVEMPYRGQRDSSVTLLFSPSWEVDLSDVRPRTKGGQTGRIDRMYVDVSQVTGPDHIAAEINGKYRSFTKHHLRDWIAFRREYDRLDFGRPRAVIPSVGDWSKPVNGLQARLAVENWRDPIVGIYLELRNVKNLGNTMTVPVDAQRIDFELLDADGAKVPVPGLPRSGPVVDLKDFQLPFDSSLRFNLSVSTVGIPDVNTMIALRSHAWALKDSSPATFRLRASFKAEKPDRFSHALWHGEIQVPSVKVQPAPRDRVSDEIVRRSYSTIRRKKAELIRVLNLWFEFEENVRFESGVKPNEIEATAHESRHRYIAEVISYQENGTVPPD